MNNCEGRLADQVSSRKSQQANDPELRNKKAENGCASPLQSKDVNVNAKQKLYKGV